MRWSKQRIGIRKTDFEKRLQEYTCERSVKLGKAMDIGRNIGVEFLKNHSGGGSTEIKNTYTKWLDEGRFFLLPNAVFTLGLCPGEMTLYAYLIFCEDRETHQCWPSIGRISQHTGMSANTTVLTCCNSANQQKILQKIKKYINTIYTSAQLCYS